jgi:hypothetical protein
MAAKDALVSLGFTALESEIYACLTREGSSSGYRVAQAIGKPAANTYKSLETLLRKGAVVQDDVKKKTYAPVAPETLLTRLNKEFEKNRTSALKALKDAGVPAPNAKLIPIATLEQAIQIAKNYMSTASETIVLIASGSVFTLLDELPTVSYCVVMTSTAARDAVLVPTEAFDHDTLELVVDHHSAVFFTANQGFAIENHPLGATLHQAVVCQIGLYQVDRKLEEDASRKQLVRLIENLP